jgi:peptide/nickel transport system permease protein
VTGAASSVLPRAIEPPKAKPDAALRRKRRRHLLRFLSARIAQAVPTLLLVIVVNFTLLNLAPGDLAQVLAGEAGGASPEYVAQLRESFGLNDPAWLRLLHYVQKVATLDLGYSFRNSMPVSELIFDRIPATLLLTGSALLLAIGVGLAGGFLAALRPGSWIDRTISLIALLVYATPGFLLGLALIIVFGVKLQWLPVGGMSSGEASGGGLGALGGLLSHLVLPVLTLGLFFASIYVRITRAAMLEVRSHDYVRTARAKGVAPLRIARRHVLRNALLPVVTLIGLQAGALLGGAVLVEVVFAWPGLGRLAFEAVFQRDFNLLSGVVLCGAAAVLLVNIGVDLLYSVLDPRIGVRQ